MRPDEALLPDDLAAAHSRIRELAETLRQRDPLIGKLQHQLEQLLRQRHGKKGGRVDPGRLLLFAPERRRGPRAGSRIGRHPGPGEASPGRPKAAGGEPAQAAGRPRRRARAPRRPGCGAQRLRIGEEAREQLGYIPASLVALEHVRPKIACRAASPTW